MPSNVTSTGHRRRPINTAVPSTPATTTNQRRDSVHRGELRIAATATRKLVPTTHESHWVAAGAASADYLTVKKAKMGHLA